MATLILQLTDAGLAAIQGEEGSDPAIIAELGLSSTPFTAAPTLTALPGEFKRLDAVSGTPVAPNMVHMTARDTSADVYDATGLGLFLADGTLLAAYSSSADPILSKAQLAFALWAFDIAFEQDLAANIEFGNAVFLYPPATETIEGVARLATQAEVNAAVDGPDDHEIIVTPKTLRARLAAFFASVTDSLNAMSASITALAGRTITGGGLVTGGGNLSANRVLTVTAASGAETLSRTRSDVAVTPAALASLIAASGASGTIVLHVGDITVQAFTASIGANVSTTVTLPEAFANECTGAWVNGGEIDYGVQDNGPWVSGKTTTQLTIVNGLSAMSVQLIAIGK